MVVSVKISSKNQIVVPKEAREALALEPGERLMVRVRDDGVIEMERKPRDLPGEMRGLFAGLPGEGPWPELDDGR